MATATLMAVKCNPTEVQIIHLLDVRCAISVLKFYDSFRYLFLIHFTLAFWVRKTKKYVCGIWDENMRKIMEHSSKRPC